MERTQQLVQYFTNTFGAPPGIVTRAPGRVNLIGEHTDYNDGFVLPVAIDRDVQVAARARCDQTVRALSLNFDKQDEFSLNAIQPVCERTTWGDYIRAVTWVLQDAGYPLQGADLAIEGNVPTGSGLSSSAAVELATLLAFCILNHLDIAQPQAARLSQRAENMFIGVQCGIMDQFISALGQAGHALLIDCRSLDYRPVALPVNMAIIIAHTGVRRGLSSSEYNLRRRQCESGAAQLSVPALRDVSPALFEARKAELHPEIAMRCEHVVYENARVLQSIEALECGDLETLGQLMIASHASLRDLYQVSCMELDAMAKIARDVPGCFGARLTGAGFGGCAVAITDRENAPSLVATIERDYPAYTGKTPEVYVCQAADGASLITG